MKPSSILSGDESVSFDSLLTPAVPSAAPVGLIGSDSFQRGGIRASLTEKYEYSKTTAPDSEIFCFVKTQPIMRPGSADPGESTARSPSPVSQAMREYCPDHQALHALKHTQRPASIHQRCPSGTGDLTGTAGSPASLRTFAFIPQARLPRAPASCRPKSVPFSTCAHTSVPGAWPSDEETTDPDVANFLLASLHSPTCKNGGTARGSAEANGESTGCVGPTPMPLSSATAQVLACVGDLQTQSQRAPGDIRPRTSSKRTLSSSPQQRTLSRRPKVPQREARLQHDFLKAREREGAIQKPIQRVSLEPDLTTARHVGSNATPLTPGEKSLTSSAPGSRRSTLRPPTSSLCLRSTSRARDYRG